MPADAATRVADGGYAHEAYLYDGDDAFVSSSVEFVTEGLARGEHAVVAVRPGQAEMLRAALGEQSERVLFIDMAECGRNPATIIQVWQDVLEAAELRGAGVRGIGEPIWDGRTRGELLEAQLHEALLNDAFGPEQRLLLRCPYDLSRLDAEVIATARATHPEVVDVSGRERSEVFAPAAVVDAAFTGSLPEPVAVRVDLRYGLLDLVRLRREVAAAATLHGLDPEQVEAVVVATREIAVNSIRHGGGSGRLRVWTEGDALVCELRDAGHIDASMVGRLRPDPDSEGGRGVWLANHLCDLVQIRTAPAGTVVRLHMVRPPKRAQAQLAAQMSTQLARRSRRGSSKRGEPST